MCYIEKNGISKRDIPLILNKPIRRPVMKIAWGIVCLIPVPFFFHFYEYEQYIKGKEASLLLFDFLFFVVLVGILSKNVRISFILLVNLLTTIVSLILAMKFIPNDGYWFTVTGRNGAVIFISIIYTIGQLIVRMIAKYAKTSAIEEN